MSAAANREFLIVRTVHAPRALVWQAWTDPRLLAQWWGPHALTSCDCQMDVRVGGTHRVTMRMPDGVRYPIRGSYLEVQPMDRLVMTMDCSEHPAAWHDMVRSKRAPGDDNAPGIMVQTVTFEDLGDSTRLCVATHFEQAAIRDAMVKLGMEVGWSESLEKLDILTAEKAGFASRRMLIRRTVKAPREMVWHAMTDPLQVVQWWGPTGFTTTIEEMDVRPGGVWKHTMHGPDGADYPNQSTFRDVAPFERLVFQHGGSRVGTKGASFVATWTFDEVEGGTLVTIHGLFPTDADRDYVVAEFGALEGGKQTLARLDDYLATLVTFAESHAPPRRWPQADR